MHFILQRREFFCTQGEVSRAKYLLALVFFLGLNQLCFPAL